MVVILEEVLGKTLGEADKNNVFARTKIYPKITGIAGDVMEQSILGYPADSYQTPDLIVDDKEIELKTTGIKISKKNKFQYSGMTIRELINELGIKVKYSGKNDLSKSITEQVVTRMFGAKAKKLSKIELFAKLGVLGKTITQTERGTRTEDTKLFNVNFDDWLIKNKMFEESTLYSDFSGNQFLFIIFEEPNNAQKLLVNKFIGFKRVSFDELFIEETVKPLWKQVRETVLKNKLVETTVL